jgi:hypothetical protein
MLRPIVALLFILPVGLASTASAANIVSDFSGTVNPNGVWTYLYNGSAYTSSQGSAAQLGTPLPGWYSGQGIPNSLYILQNTTGSNYSTGTIVDPTGTLWLDPESGNVAVRFTASAAGTYTIAGSFIGIDVSENSHPVQIFDGSTSIFNSTISTYGQNVAFNLSETLAAGQTITFEVETGSAGCSYCYLSTGLDGTITLSGSSAPEPAPWGLAMAGLVLVGAKYYKLRP